MGRWRHVVSTINRFWEGNEGQLVGPVVAAVFSLMLLPAWADALSTVGSVQERWAAAVVGCAYTVGCVVAIPVSERLRGGASLTCAVLLVLGGVFVALSGLESSWVLLGALGIVAATLSPVAILAITTVTTTAVYFAGTTDPSSSTTYLDVYLLPSVTLGTALVVRLANAYEELREARNQVATLAVGQERERIARDLHDILGHSLTTITLKAGLARRMLESGNTDHAHAEISGVEQLGRQALRDMRQTVTGFREVSLPYELAAARDALATAGITPELPQAVDDVPTLLRPVFGAVLREAVTNVVRHSGARTAWVRLGPGHITITDDGRGPEGMTAGNGVRGLRERMAQVGGTLTISPGPHGGCEVRASVPPQATRGAQGHPPTGPEHLMGLTRGGTQA
jgi:two-component system sensor histidine kinase DesK